MQKAKVSEETVLSRGQARFGHRQTHVLISETACVSGVWVENDILFPFFSVLLFSWESLLM